MTDRFRKSLRWPLYGAYALIFIVVEARPLVIIFLRHSLWDDVAASIAQYGFKVLAGFILLFCAVLMLPANKEARNAIEQRLAKAQEKRLLKTWETVLAAAAIFAVIGTFWTFIGPLSGTDIRLRDALLQAVVYDCVVIFIICLTLLARRRRAPASAS